MTTSEHDIRRHTEHWVQRVVVALTLCPFAGREVDAGRVRYHVTSSDTELLLLQALEEEIGYLQAHSDTATSLLIHPQVLQDFDDYNQFLDLAEGLLHRRGAVGELQIASFHPDYRFAGTDYDDAENYSNRSPYPMLHLLREADVAAAIDHHPDPDAIPERNIAHLNRLGSQHLVRLLASCRGD
ncbi:MAG: DUF1415 domain-containing protein [Chromatocurvus sp.]